MRSTTVRTIIGLASFTLLLALAPHANALITNCYGPYGNTALPPGYEDTWTFYPNGQPINGYAYQTYASGPDSFSYAWHGSTYTLNVYVINTGSSTLSYTFNVCFTWN